MDRDSRARASCPGRALALSVLLDTNVVVRHLTGVPEAQARRATELLQSSPHLRLEDLIVAETVYVLRSVYRVSREDVAVLLRTVLAYPAISVRSSEDLLRALDLFEIEGLDFAEAYLIAVAEVSGFSVASFDRSLDRVETVTRIEP